MKRALFRRGQSLTEIALIIGVAGLVFIGMEIYFKRGLQGKVKDLTDYIIGEKQEAYQEDTSGLEVPESSSQLIADSTATLSESLGGGKSIISNETSISNYTSESQDSLGN